MEAIREFLDMEITVWQMMLVVSVMLIVGGIHLICVPLWQIRRKKRKEKEDGEWEQLKKNYPDLW